VTDSLGHHTRSETLYSLYFANTLPNVYVSANAVFPFDGTQAHPFPTLGMGLNLVSPGGNVFVANGVYLETNYLGNVNIVGANKNTVIIQTLYGNNEVFHIQDGAMVNISNVTIANSQYGFLPSAISNQARMSIRDCIIRNTTTGFYMLGGEHYTISNCDLYNNGAAFMFTYAGLLTANKTITNCNIHNNGIGVSFTTSQIANNVFIHNNFFSNTNSIAAPYGAGINTWDNGATGNYWDTYRAAHPTAHIIPATGTWDTPYTIIATNNIDHHPWVYPNGYIDTIPPQVTVVYPNGGETVNGHITITWTATDDMTSNLSGTIGISYSADAGSTWHSIASHQANSGSYVWDTNSVSDGTQYLIKVNATDAFQNTGFDTSNGMFTILNHPNQAPNIPRQPTGPTSGYIGLEYTYTTNTTDPNNDQVSYMWDWGDGNLSSWIGPFASGAVVSTPYTWATAGTYNVKVRARDTSNATSDWSTPLAVTIAPMQQLPNLTVEQFKGGFGLSAVVTNIGNAVATNVNWSIVLDGKLIFKGKNTNGVIPSIEPNGSVTIKTGLILGFGKTNIVATATASEGATYTEYGTARVFLIFVYGVTEPLP